MNEAVRLAIEKGGYENLDPSQQAICLAIEAGYKNPNLIYDEPPLWAEEIVITDPLFWQALGKALGWGQVKKTVAVFRKNDYYLVDEWKEKAHQYFDLFLTGGDTEKFWKELLNQ